MLQLEIQLLLLVCYLFVWAGWSSGTYDTDVDLPYHLYNHKGQPQHRELHALLKVIKIKSSVKGAPAVSSPKMTLLLKTIP